MMLNRMRHTFSEARNDRIRVKLSNLVHNINLRVFVITSFALRSCLTVFLFVLQAGLFRGSKDSDMDHWPEISW